MSRPLFRQKSLKRISSPEQLNAYIRVSTPSVWLVLAAIVLLLAGACVWGVLGRLDTTLPVAVLSREGTVTAYVRQADVQKVRPDAAVRLNGAAGRVASVQAEPVQVDEGFPEYLRHVGGLLGGEWVHPIALDISCADGVYAAQIVIDSVPPMAFVLN